jgi:hypothetical protein
MNWTMSQFYADGGTTRFADRIASSLGIKVANIKVVSVYEGSVVVDFQVIEDKQKTLATKGGIDKVQNVLTSKLSQKSISLGAPILNAQISSTKATDRTALDSELSAQANAAALQVNTNSTQL